ncbi:MAG: hypothetical protein VX904_09520, partial [Planctomycetota bacterium]|nr:hypothetical protein [Planctomycetota bacterium]
DVVHAYVFQMNKICVDGKLPPKVQQLMEDKRLIFVGKNVEKELKEFFDLFGCDPARRASILYVDVLHLIQACDLLSRDDPEEAAAFAADGSFRTNTNVPEGVYPEVLGDAGIRAAVNYFLHQSIDKCVEHVHPNKTNWHTEGALTDKMLKYAVTDAEAAHRCLIEAATRLSLRPRDFARRVRIDIKTKRKTLTRLITTAIEKLAKDLKEGKAPEHQIRDVRRAREIHEDKMLIETKRWRKRHDNYVALRDPWREKNGYHHLDDDPFSKGGLHWLLFFKKSHLEILEFDAEEISPPTVDAAAGKPAADVKNEDVFCIDSDLEEDMDEFRSPERPAAAMEENYSPSKPTSSSTEMLVDESTPSEVATASNTAAAAAPEAAAAVSEAAVTAESSSSSSQISGREMCASATASTGRLGQSTSEGGARVDPSWDRVVDYFNRADDIAIDKELERLVARNDEQQLMALILYVVRRVRQKVTPIIAAKLIDFVPFRLMDTIARELCTKKIIHPNYLQSLNILGLSLGAIVVLDLLAQGKDGQNYILDYLPRISKQDAIKFADFASKLMGLSASEVKRVIRAHSLFDDNFAEGIDDAKFSDSRIGDLIVQVCEAKNVEIPVAARVQRTEDFFGILYDNFKNHQVNTSDLAAMVDEALGGYELPASVAIDFFKDRIPDIAARVARRNYLPVPAAPTSGESMVFVNPPCEAFHKDFASVMGGVTEMVVVRDLHVETLKAQLQVSNGVAVLHHEPPTKLPRAPRIDSLVIRTRDYAFHLLLKDNHAIAATVVGLLREYSTECVIFARGPANMEKFLLGKFGFVPAFFDVHQRMTELVREKQPSLNDLSRFITKSDVCWRAKFFSADTVPSRAALHHRAVLGSLIYRFGILCIDLPGSGPGERSVEAQLEIDRKAAEEERVRQEETREEEERRRQEEEAEAERRRQEEELLEQERVAEEEKQQFERRIERERLEMQQQLEEKKKAIDDKRRRVAAEREEEEERRSRAEASRGRTEESRPASSSGEGSKRRRSSPSHGHRSSPPRGHQGASGSRHRGSGDSHRRDRYSPMHEAPRRDSKEDSKRRRK